MAKKNRSFSFSRSAKSLQDNASNAGAAAGASYTLVGGIILLGGLGYLLDKWQGTGPWGLVVGLALGIIVGFYDLVPRASWVPTPTLRSCTECWRRWSWRWSAGL
jgi:ATP synthase protein I